MRSRHFITEAEGAKLQKPTEFLRILLRTSGFEIFFTRLAAFSYWFAFPALFAVTTGCGGDGFDIAPVRGVVTLDGKPITGVEVVFAPIADANNPNPGPFSKGVTDAEGRYTLQIRGESTVGAVVGKNRVGISYPEVSDALVQVEVDKAVKAAKKNQASITADDIAKIAAEVQQRQGGTKLPASYNANTTLRFDVTEEGNDSANFDLKSDGS